MVAAVAAAVCASVYARPEFRKAFHDAHPDAAGTAIETASNQPNHSGVSHGKFSGGGQRNPHGDTVRTVLAVFPGNEQRWRNAIQTIGNGDSDRDSRRSLIAITDMNNYTHTPGFPGLTSGHFGGADHVDRAVVQDQLTPAIGADTTPPDVTVVAPNGGETLAANAATTVEWTATDPSGIAGINLYLSDDGGVTFTAIALGVPHTGGYTWFPANRPTGQALLRVEAIDGAFNAGQDETDAVFTIASPPGGIVPTTLRDFDLPGSQPLESGVLTPPTACRSCHGNYDERVEPYFNWQGSMMAHASRDPLFEACMTVANQDAPDSGDLCLRCHIPRGWLQGRSVPTDGSQMRDTDKTGVSCDFCHRMVDPIYAPANPLEDEAILAGLRFPPSDFGGGMAVIDPTGARRGPFLDANIGHAVLVSPFHREAALCGTCHDVHNPAFSKDEYGNYVPNAFDAAATDFSAADLMPIERTYSEWLNSAYNSPEGVFAPQFGGNKEYVATCQDCHMRDVTGRGCSFGPIRNDLPLHDLTGGSTWLPGLLGSLYPNDVDPEAVEAAIARARYMLQHAAELAVAQDGRRLTVTVTNETGHKLPSGYPEGRRIWLNVKFRDATRSLLAESGAYDPATGVLAEDAEVKVYETKLGLDAVTAPLVGVEEGPSFHFVLNNRVFKDNRIPPRGFTNGAYATFGGAPVAYTYADGQYWDDTVYVVPVGAVSAEVTLYYQSTSKEYIEFLRDENTTNTKGQELYDLWNENGKCPPEVMATADIELAPPAPGDYDGDDRVDLNDYAAFVPCLTGPPGGTAFPCDIFDFDRSATVDLRDYGFFQAALTAP